MEINVALSGAENIVALINDTNASELVLTSQVTVGVPSVAAGTGGRNTAVTVTGAGIYTGTVDLSYTRNDVSSGVATPDYNFTIDGDTTTGTFKTQVATQLGLREDEITVTGSLPTGPGEETTMHVAGINNSLLYVGPGEDLTVTWPAIALSSVITNTDLTGFDPAAA